jgi:hypothetical protein
MKKTLLILSLPLALSVVAGIRTNYVNQVSTVPVTILKTNVETTYSTDTNGNLITTVSTNIGKVLDTIQVTNRVPIYENTVTHRRWLKAP